MKIVLLLILNLMSERSSDYKAKSFDLKRSNWTGRPNYIQYGKTQGARRRLAKKELDYSYRDRYNWI